MRIGCFCLSSNLKAEESTVQLPRQEKQTEMFSFKTLVCVSALLILMELCNTVPVGYDLKAGNLKRGKYNSLVVLYDQVAASSIQ